MKKLIPLVVILAFWVFGCSDKLLPIGPSDVGGSGGSSGPSIDISREWSPYVVVQPTGEAYDAYKDAIPKLMQNGTLRGIRVELYENLLENHTTRMLSSLGIEILGLIDNGFLSDPNVEARIDQIFQAYPEIYYFQVGNEIGTIMPGHTMSMEQYMPILKRVYNHVQKNHPGRAMLVSESTIGAGNYGAQELEQMVRLGLTEMSPDKLIVSVNCYTPSAATQYYGIINGPLKNYRIWVTETGITNPNLHVSYVKNEYPKLRNYLRAERIYWYALWAGDSGTDVDFGLIRKPQQYPNYWKSPLFQLLERRR